MAATVCRRRRSPTTKRTAALWLSVALAVALAVALLGVASTRSVAEEASEPTPPEAVLLKGDQVLQRGSLAAFDWENPPVGANEDYAARYPGADRVAAGRTLHIRVYEPQQPSRFKIFAYRKPYDYGNERLLRTSMRPVVDGGGDTVVWDVFFKVRRPDRHYYLDAFGIWKPLPGDNDGYQDAVWLFHVRTR